MRNKIIVIALIAVFAGGCTSSNVFARCDADSVTTSVNFTSKDSPESLHADRFRYIVLTCLARGTIVEEPLKPQGEIIYTIDIRDEKNGITCSCIIMENRECFCEYKNEGNTEEGQEIRKLVIKMDYMEFRIIEIIFDLAIDLENE